VAELDDARVKLSCVEIVLFSSSLNVVVSHVHDASNEFLKIGIYASMAQILISGVRKDSVVPVL
jgi:hypothetical protein